jgi:hypothetical protein
MAKVSERLVADEAARLGAGGLSYTPRQLYYAVCGALERPEVTVGASQALLGVVLTVVGVVLGILATVYMVLLVIVGVVVTAMGLQNRRRERNRPTTRPLALAYDDFVGDVIAPRRTGSATDLPGLIVDASSRPALDGDDGAAPLVVCDRPETAALLAAMNGTAGFAVRAVDEQDAGQLVSGRRVFALHDCDPSGCGLPLRLRDDGASEVVDIGLRPAQIAHRHTQVIEGAPALVPRETAAVLTPEEMVWLAEGRRVELAVLTPQELLGGVRRAVAGGAVQPPGPAPVGVRLAEVPLLATEPARPVTA